MGSDIPAVTPRHIARAFAALGGGSGLRDASALASKPIFVGAGECDFGRRGAGHHGTDLVIDTGAPAGDSMITIEGLDTPVSPGSTVGGVMIINSIKAELAQLLTNAGHPPKVLTAGCVVGTEKATALFEAAYDEHGQRLAVVLKSAGGVSR